MNTLLKRSLLDKIPVDIIYMKKDGSFTKRTILVRRINQKHVEAYCFMVHQLRTFYTENILAVAPTRQRGNSKYA